MKIISIILKLSVIAYVLVAFCSWEISPAYWGTFGRLFFVLYVFFGLCINVYRSARNKSVDEFEAKREEREQNMAEINRKKGGFNALLQRQLDKAEEARKAKEN